MKIEIEGIVFQPTGLILGYLTTVSFINNSMITFITANNYIPKPVRSKRTEIIYIALSNFLYKLTYNQINCK